MAKGQTASGKFAPGNKLGKGGPRPNAGRKPAAANECRAMLLDDFPAMLARMRKIAADKDPKIAAPAITWWCNQVIGQAPQSVTVKNKATGAPAFDECNQALVAAIRDVGKP